jgi:ribulose-phosphate 3-epimerase
MIHRPDRPEILARLRAATPSVLPSLLLCDFGNLERELGQLQEAAITSLHFDVMDGVFVQNFTYGMPIIAALRDRTNLIFDVHLMITEPARSVKHFRDAGADVITIHAEAVDDPRPVLDKIRQLGAVAGLAVNPSTPVESIETALPNCDIVLVMSVEAGFGGQPFNEVALEKLEQLSAVSGSDPLLEIDGGINATTIGHCAESGAHLMVVGSAIFNAPDYQNAIGELRDVAQGAIGISGN